MNTAAPDLAALLGHLAQLLDKNSAPTPPPPARPMPERVLLTVEEAAQQLRVGRTVAWRLVKEGDLESVLIGRLRRVPAAAVTDYAARLLAQQSRKSRP